MGFVLLECKSARVRLGIVLAVGVVLGFFTEY
jgi:hypothetical protein